MAINRNGAAIRRLRAAFDVGAIRELTDGQLLERFATDRGEGAELAFAALVERHGPMVLRVARGVLGDPHDAQDAFQATFLVLVRKARGLWVRDSLGPWLHQVARRTAACARANAARRRHHEGEAATIPREARPAPADDLARLLHEEVDRLPGRYRAAVVLCDLEGRTHEQAARHLGWPVGTVKSRLSRGRDRLRDRLVRRGLAPASGVLLASSIADASLPPTLADAAVLAASRALATPGVATVPAAILAREVIRSMTILHWSKLAASGLLLGATTLSGVGLMAGQGFGPDPKSGAVPAAVPVPVAGTGEGGQVIETLGIVEPSSARNVVSQVEGTATILRIMPEGTKVKFGEVVADLDSAGLRDQLTSQRIATSRAEAAYRQALLVREVSEYAIKEYVEGVFKQDEDSGKNAVALAQAAIGRAEARRDRTRAASKRMAEVLTEKGPARSAADILAELEIVDRLEDSEQAIARERKALEERQSQLEVLTRYTRDKQVKSLTADAEKARADEQVKHDAWMLERSKAAKIERQIRACVLESPGDGVVVYANDPRKGPGKILIEEGAVVRERQIVFKVPDTGVMRVNAKVPEAWVDRVKIGSRVKIRVEAMPDRLLEGVVTTVSPMADPGSTLGGDSKFYTTFVRIEDGPAALRSGMTAKVEMPLGEGQAIPPR